MLDECAPKYLPFSKCISREQELQTMKADKRIVVLEEQQLQAKNRAPKATADLSTGLKVANAFVRRGLACEQAGLLTYETHEKIRHAFMSHMSRTAPPWFRAPDIAAVLRADRELWMKAFELCRSNLRVDADGKHPLDTALLQLYNSAEVVFNLLPTPGSAPVKRARSSSCSLTALRQRRQKLRLHRNRPTADQRMTGSRCLRRSKVFQQLTRAKLASVTTSTCRMAAPTAVTRRTGIYDVSRETMSASSAVASMGYKVVIRSDKWQPQSHPVLQKAVCVEIFCGKTRLSRRLRAKQFQVISDISVDHLASKGIPILRIDVSKKSQRLVLEELLRLDCSLYVHFAPPCGTASAARSIKPGPPPLRSINFPMELKGLSFVQRARVSAANFLYQWTWKMIQELDARNVGWSVETPQGL